MTTSLVYAYPRQSYVNRGKVQLMVQCKMSLQGFGMGGGVKMR